MSSIGRDRMVRSLRARQQITGIKPSRR